MTAGPRPKCSFRWCDSDAAWAAPDYRAEATGSPEFVCEYHFEKYSKFKIKPARGLDPPPGAQDFWRPSIIEMIRHADMEIRRQERAKKPPSPTAIEYEYESERMRRYTPTQRAALFRLRELQRRVA